MSSDEVRWTALLDNYEFGIPDEFDLVLANAVDEGYFNVSEIQKCAAKLDRRIKAGISEQASGEGWRLFRDSFWNNEIEVVEKMVNNTIKNAEFISPMNLSATVSLASLRIWGT
jgi:hypothetical protein